MKNCINKRTSKKESDSEREKIFLKKAARNFENETNKIDALSNKLYNLVSLEWSE